MGGTLTMAPKWSSVAGVLLAVSAAVCGCRGARPRHGCQLGGAEQYSYCFFARREYLAPFHERAAGPCPRGYDAARVEVAKGTVCLAQPTATVPPEVCASLPEGCASVADRHQVTPTDRRRDALTRALGMGYQRCVEGGIRLDPVANRLGEADLRAREAQLRTLYSHQRNVWGTGMQPCCGTRGEFADDMCISLRLSTQTPAELDAALVELASFPAGPDGGRPALTISTAPPEP